jgi:hypothetical protein
MVKRSVILVAVLAGVLAAVPAVGVSATAKDGDIRVAGTCTGPSTSKLKLSRENGRIEVEFEVDQNRNGMRWNVVLRHNGNVAARMSRVTKAPSGSFAARKLVGNSPGADVIRATASRAGQTCTARATFPA